MVAFWWCCSGALLVVAIWWWRRVWSTITTAKEKRLSEDRSPYKSHILPLYSGIGLTTHDLTEISHLGTFMVQCEFPKPQQYIHIYSNPPVYHGGYVPNLPAVSENPR